MHRDYATVVQRASLVMQPPNPVARAFGHVGALRPATPKPLAQTFPTPSPALDQRNPPPLISPQPLGYFSYSKFGEFSRSATVEHETHLESGTEE
jgi:hypothetical protein